MLSSILAIVFVLRLSRNSDRYAPEVKKHLDLKHLIITNPAPVQLVGELMK